MSMDERQSKRGPGIPGLIVVIVGPTAVGKTEVALEVAARLRGEIVSCDSMQVYRGMDIGTAKPSLAERARIPHHVIDVADPDEPFNVARFQELARAAIDDIVARGASPILVGGTGLYVQAVVDGFLFPWSGASADIRRSLEREARERGVQALHARLEEVDRVAARKIHPNDARRIIRALEVYLSTGRPISDLWTAGAVGRGGRGRALPPDSLVVIGLVRDRESLYERIDRRCERMVAAGLADETAQLLARGYERALTAAQALGYREMVAYLRGRSTLAEAVALIKRNTRRYAKRQLTWFRADPRVEWVDLGTFGTTSEAASCVIALVRGKLAAATRTRQRSW